jgi:hypothetical protein
MLQPPAADAAAPSDQAEQGAVLAAGAAKEEGTMRAADTDAGLEGQGTPHAAPEQAAMQAADADDAGAGAWLGTVSMDFFATHKHACSANSGRKQPYCNLGKGCTTMKALIDKDDDPGCSAVRDVNNQYDDNAIELRVHVSRVNSAKVGMVSREQAAALAPALDADTIRLVSGKWGGGYTMVFDVVPGEANPKGDLPPAVASCRGFLLPDEDRSCGGGGDY